MLRILIVEDEEKVRKLYVELLENEGYAVATASDALEANEILKYENFDIILLDINLPQVYGSILFEVMQMFHEKTKVIVTSVYPLYEQKRIIRDAADYYDKVQSVDVLLEKIKKVSLSIMSQSKVLVIDDEVKVRKLLCNQINDLGYRTLEAEDGEAGLALFLKESNIGLVILDIALPKKSGMEVYKKIKERIPLVKVIVSSVFPEDEQRLLIKAADDYFDKADCIDVFIDKVKQVLNFSSNA